MGTGILALPAAYAKAGLFGGIGLGVVGAALAAMSIYMLEAAAVRYPCHTRGGAPAAAHPAAPRPADPCGRGQGDALYALRGGTARLRQRNLNRTSHLHPGRRSNVCDRRGRQHYVDLPNQPQDLHGCVRLLLCPALLPAIDGLVARRLARLGPRLPTRRAAPVALPLLAAALTALCCPVQVCCLLLSALTVLAFFVAPEVLDPCGGGGDGKGFEEPVLVAEGAPSTALCHSASIKTVGEPMALFNMLPTFMLAYFCQHNTFTVLSELENPTPARKAAAVGIALCVVIATYTVVASAGYLTFGDLVASNVCRSDHWCVALASTSPMYCHRSSTRTPPTRLLSP